MRLALTAREMSDRMARCRRISRLLTAYADDELSLRLRARVESHLERCEHCSRELDSIVSLGRILKKTGVPEISQARWSGFERELSSALDGVDSESRRPARIRESRPVFVDYRRLALATAAACAFTVVVVFAVTRFPGAGIALGPSDFAVRSFGGGGNECVVESIETRAAGCTPMCFVSDEAEMTVIWVFSEPVESGESGNGPGAL